ncbi:MAG: iron ABC transporter permease [Geminicoccaceae bacterium]
MAASLVMAELRLLRRMSLPLLAGAALVAFVVALSVGAYAVPPEALLLALAETLHLVPAGTADARDVAVLAGIRLPRVLLGAIGGASLAAAGAAIQGLFRNPLADPGLVGVSSGAAFAAVAAIVLGGRIAVLGGLGPWLLPLAAFAGGLAATWVVARIASRGGAVDIAAMLLAGIAVNAIAMAGIGALVFASDDRELRELTFWMFGSLAGTGWPRLLAALPLLLLPLLALPLLARSLNALLLGEADAFHLGFAVDRAKRVVVVLAALATGAFVALAGIVGFVGLIAPHLARSLVGPDHRALLPASACVGAILLLVADLVARTAVAPAELPIGVVTAALGGPFFLWLMARPRP